MSVQTLDPKTFEKIYHKAVNYKYNRTVNREYSEILSRLSEEEIQNIVTIWCNLNEESYCKRYEEGRTLPRASSLISFNFGLPGFSAFQMLKYLHFLKYNIEISTINRQLNQSETKAMHTLVSLISKISTAIISELPEYQNSSWGSN